MLARISVFFLHQVKYMVYFTSLSNFYLTKWKSTSEALARILHKVIAAKLFMENWISASGLQTRNPFSYATKVKSKIRKTFTYVFEKLVKTRALGLWCPNGELIFPYGFCQNYSCFTPKNTEIGA